MNKTHFPLILFLCAVTGLAAGQPVTLDDCYASAVLRSHSLIDQREQLDQAAARKVQARAGLLPVLSAGEIFQFNKDSQNQGGTRFSVSQPLFSGFRYFSLFLQAGFLAEAQKSAFTWACKQLYLETAQAYYSALSLRSDLVHYSEQAEIYDKRIRELSGWVAIGKARPGDLASVKAARALAESQRILVSASYTNALRSLAFMTGLPDTMSLADGPTDSPAVTDGEIPISSLSNREDIRAFRLRVDAARKAVNAAAAGYFPAVSASAGYTIPNWLKTGSADWDAQISLSYAIFSGGGVTGKVSEAKSQKRQAENSSSAAFDAAVRDLKSGRTVLLAEVGQREAARQAVSFARENLSLLEKDYAFGTAKVTDVLTALSSLADAERLYDRLRYSILADSIRLQFLSGRLQLPGGTLP